MFQTNNFFFSANLVVGEIFAIDCRGSVFELPCPASFVSGSKNVPYFKPQGQGSCNYVCFRYFRITENVVVGNLRVEADDAFGGGQLRVSGPASPTQKFELSLVGI